MPQKSQERRWFLVIKTPKYATTNRISINKCQTGSSPVTTGMMSWLIREGLKLVSDVKKEFEK
jgi:hypothetical protein